MTSSERMTCLVDHDICNGVTLMDKCCHIFERWQAVSGFLSVSTVR